MTLRRAVANVTAVKPADATRSEPTLAERLGAALLPAADASEDPQSTADRILDAATRRFVEVGIGATTMSSIATTVGLSREWVYRNFANKQAVVQAVLERELRRFIDGLARSVTWDRDVAARLTDTFVYCVEYFRDQPVVQGLLGRDLPGGINVAGPHAIDIVGVAVSSCADYLVELGGFERARADVVAETLVRLVGSTLVVPRATLDLHDPIVLRSFAARVVPAIVRDDP